MPQNPQHLSLCIPRVFSNITWRQIKETFETLLGKGCVSRVDLISKTTEDGEPFGRVFVHLRYWPKTEVAQAMRKLLVEDGGTAKIVYDEPWFWKVSLSRVPKPERDREKAAPYLDFGSHSRAAPPSATIGDALSAATTREASPERAPPPASPVTVTNLQADEMGASSGSGEATGVTED